MDIFFDTSVLVAASSRNHPQHLQAFSVLRRVARKQDRGFLSIHSIAEVYAALTRLPVEPRIHSVEAVRIIKDNLLPHFEVVPLTKADYLETLSMVGDKGWTGAKIYDVLLLRCAAKHPVDRIYTFNLTDFRRMAPPNLLDKISAP